MKDITEKEEILQFLKENKQDLLSEFKLVKIGLFGSFARDAANERSDIDILVEFEPDTENLFEKKSALKALIQKRFHKDVDICREKYIKPYFKNQILQSVIYV
jgi:predicted nucleotidyltransferase